MITHTTFLSLNHSTLKSALESPFQKEAPSHQLQWLLPKHHHSNNWSVMQKWTCWFVNQRLNKSLVSRWHLYTMMYKLPCKSQAMFTQLQSTVNIRLNGHTVRLQAQHYYWSHSLKNVGLNWTCSNILAPVTKGAERVGLNIGGVQVLLYMLICTACITKYYYRYHIHYRYYV